MKDVKIRTRDKSQAIRCWDILKKQTLEFCRETGLHGYRYISQTQRSKTERIIWAIIVIASFCCAFVLIKMSWDFYASHPTLTVIESTHHGIWNYPFPAITICDMNRMSYNLTKKFVDGLKIPDDTSKEHLIQELRLMNELLAPGVFGYDVEKNLTHLQRIIDHNHLSIFNVISSITQSCSAMLLMCKWKGRLVPCGKYFKRSLTRDGLCCSFNYYISPNTASSDNLEKSAACGYETGMTVIVNPEPNDYHATITGTYGLKTMIHYLYDYPDYNAEAQLIQLNSQYFLSVNPMEMYSKKEVEKLAISTRNCIFDDEADKIYANNKKRNLTFAKYSYHNCLAECRASMIRAKCGCIPYYFPQNSAKVCNLRDVKCLKKYQWYFDTSWPEIVEDNQTQISLLLITKLNEIKSYPCGCIPDCAVYSYPVESSFGYLNSNIYYNSGSFSKNSSNANDIKNHSIIHVFFNDLVAFQFRQSVNYSWRNLFASFGGLLGLFAGFSLISVFEILYFFVIRVIIDTYTNSRKHNNVK